MHGSEVIKNGNDLKQGSSVLKYKASRAVVVFAFVVVNVANVREGVFCRYCKRRACPRPVRAT